MVAVVQLGNGQFPPEWRGGTCLMAGIYPDPENSPAPGLGFFPEKKLFSPFRWKKLEISGKNWKKWKFPEKTMLSLLYLKMNVIKWYHISNVG